MISRSRRYEQGIPLALDLSAIQQYLELYESPCEIDVFIECMIAIDNEFLDKAYNKAAA